MFLVSFSLKAQTQAEMNRTAFTAYNKADAELNKIYKKVIGTLDEKQKLLLIKAQKDWLKFRDSHCKFDAEQYNGGSIQPLIYSSCLTEKTEDRISDLKAILEN